MGRKLSLLPIPTAASMSLLDPCPHFSCHYSPQSLPRSHFCQRRQTQRLIKSSEPHCCKPGFIISPHRCPHPNDLGFLPVVTPARKTVQGSASIVSASAYMHQTVPELIPVFIHAPPHLDSAPHSASGLPTAVSHSPPTSAPAHPLPPSPSWPLLPQASA